MLKQRLNIFGVASVYVGAILGAGFASGREIWQFFGVFGTWGIPGVVLVGFLFIGLGMMTASIALKLGTNDMGRVIVPAENKVFIQVVGYFMAFILFTVLITMSAAGGALFYQQLGLSRILGGALVVVLVLATVLGGFDRVARAFRFVMPVLAGMIIVICIAVLLIRPDPSGMTAAPTPSPLTPFWWVSAILYISYNILGVIPIVATAAINSENRRTAMTGTALGGFFLMLLAMAILGALRYDPGLSQTMELPMLALSALVAPWMNLLYTAVLFFAIYASATGNFYGFTTKLGKTDNKQKKIIAFAVAGFLLGLMGFRNIIAYIYPVEGFAGILIILLLSRNYIALHHKEKEMKQSNHIRDFENHNRLAFPDGIVRVTGGKGGESLLVIGTDKTALIDAGMAYSAEGTVSNIEKALAGRTDSRGELMTLDYILVSHTHYDHVGGVPALRKRWPDAIVCGSEYAAEVLKRSSVIKVIQRMGEIAAASFGGLADPKISVEGLHIDRILADGEILPLGEESIHVLATAGHTNCSATFVLEPAGIMFASESTGVLEGRDRIHSAVLKSYEDSMESLKKCRQYGARQIISPHYGLVPETYTKQYWDIFEDMLTKEWDFLDELDAKGLSEQEMMERYTQEFWIPERADNQPFEAFRLNARNTIKTFLKGKKENKRKNND